MPENITTEAVNDTENECNDCNKDIDINTENDIVNKDNNAIDWYETDLTDSIKDRNKPYVKIKDGVTEIPDRCFQFSKLLKEIHISNSVKTIGNYCFYYCTSLEKISIPNSVTKIGSNCFMNCVSLKTIHNASKLEFRNLKTKLGFPGHCIIVDPDNEDKNKDTDNIEWYETDLNDSREDRNKPYVKIKDGVTEIPDKCFCRINNLKEIIIPNSVTKIEVNGFRDCISLEKINIPDSVKEIGDYCFAGCKALKEINIPNSVQKIGEYCFRNCYSLIEINIPDSVKKIGEYCFAGCDSLEEIHNNSELKLRTLRNTLKISNNCVIDESGSEEEDYDYNEDTGNDYLQSIFEKYQEENISKRDFYDDDITTDYEEEEEDYSNNNTNNNKETEPKFYPYQDTAVKNNTASVNFKNNNYIKVISETLGEFDGSKLQFFNSGIYIKPTNTLKCLMQLGGLCAEKQKNEEDPEETVSVISDPVMIKGGFDDAEHEYRIRLSCTIENGAKFNSYAFILFMYMQRFIFTDLYKMKEIYLTDKQHDGYFIVREPTELLSMLALNTFGKEANLRRGRAYQQMLNTFDPVYIDLAVDNEYVYENQGDKHSLFWYNVDNGAANIYLNLFYFFDLLVMTPNFKNITPNFLNHHKGQLRLIILSLCLELNEQFGKYRNGFISLKKAVGVYLYYPCNKDRTKLLKKKRHINDLTEIRKSGLFSKLNFRYEGVKYNLDDLQDNKILNAIDLNKLQISYEINRNKDYNLTFENKEERQRRKTKNSKKSYVLGEDINF